jgi:hypothetical protein
MKWYNVSLIPNRQWDRQMKRLAQKTSKVKARNSRKVIDKQRINWLKRERGNSKK